MSQRRRTVAAFLDYMTLFSGGYQAQVRTALEEQCQQRDVNLWLVVGRDVDEGSAQCRAYNSIYELIGPSCVDGVVVLSTCLGAKCGLDGIDRFLQRYRSMPCCSLGVSVPNVPSVVIDNRRSMDRVLEHMIVDHGSRRVAFIAGTASSTEAAARLRSYRATLERHGLELDPARIAYGDFIANRGGEAMEEILDRGVEIDAVVAANDLMAFGAIQALRKRGYRVPEDVPVTGFDDLAVSRLEDPPLTTVAQPFSAMAQAVLQSVIDQMEGRVVTHLTELPAQLVVRRSCGCQATTELGSSAAARDFVVEHERCRELDQLRGFSPNEVSTASLDTSDGAALAREREQLSQRTLIDETLRRIISVGERISVALDLPALADAVAESLPWAGFRTAFLSRYVDENWDELQALVGLHQGQRVLVPSSAFPAAMLIPPGSYPSEQRHSLLAFPLVLDTERLGVVVFEHACEIHGYQMIRDQIAAQLKTVTLHQQVVEKSLLHERSVQERVASCKRMESLAVLAGGVAHDLNNVLGPLLALPDVLLSETAQLTGAPETLDTMRADLQSIRSAALRAAHTIKDLLTVSRQAMARKKHLDLNQLVLSCQASETARFKSGQKAVTIELDPASEPLVILGAQGQLERAIDNLVRNALDAIANTGTVKISAAPVRLEAPLAGYETVPAGDYAAVSVADDGRGIDANDLGRVFEPFFTRRRGEDAGRSGLGLAIVHGVVKDHDGFIDLESRPGEGTRITLYFPRAYAPASEASVRPEASAGTASILLVDDEPVQLRTGRRVLAHLGYQVETVNSGRKAIQLFAAATRQGMRPYDLVIMDVLLNEDKDGLDTLQEIHRLFPEQRAILASGHAPDARAELAMTRGVKWLTKPYTVEALAQAVQTMLATNESNCSSGGCGS